MVGVRPISRRLRPTYGGREPGWDACGPRYVALPLVAHRERDISPPALGATGPSNCPRRHCRSCRRPSPALPCTGAGCDSSSLSLGTRPTGP